MDLAASALNEGKNCICCFFKKLFLSLYVLLSAQVLYGGEGVGKGENGC